MSSRRQVKEAPHPSPLPVVAGRGSCDGVLRRGSWAVVLATVTLTASCGYRFAAPNSQLPQGITRVQVPVFNNRTAEPGAEALFTAALREQLFRAGRLGDASSGATVEGELTGVASAVLAASPGRLPNYRLTASLTLLLKKNGALVARADVSGGEDYPAGADVLWAENYRAAALRRLAETLTREGLERLATGW